MKITISEIQIKELTEWLSRKGLDTVLIPDCGTCEIVTRFRAQGCNAYGQTTLDAVEKLSAAPYCHVGELADQPRQFDALVILNLPVVSGEAELQDCIRKWTARSGIILIIESDEGLSKWAQGLAAVGYNRQPSAQKEAFIVFYGGQAISKVVQEYEDALWELQQTKERQSALLADYHHEAQTSQQEALSWQQKSQTYQQETQFWQQKVQTWRQNAQFWHQRWEAFEASRTWRMLMAFQTVRQFLVPRGSRREAMIYRTARFFRRTINSINNSGGHGQNNKNIDDHLSPRVIEGQVCEVEDIIIHPEVLNHSCSVDIIICVHNALEDVRLCLSSVIEWTTAPYRIILVDDGSGLETAAYLRDFSKEHPGSLLLRSEEGTGYTYAANRGLRASSGEYVVLLNSDTIVTPFWIDRMIACAESDPKIGVVGPLSNTASWQSVPKIEENGDWAANPLPAGMSVEQMGRLIATSSARLYPLMPLINGFCMLVKQKLIADVGIFDEENFGRGYGEENDFVLRARKQGWLCALADDTYIYHAQSRSYSTEKRRELSQRAGQILTDKHGEQIIQEGIEYAHKNRCLEGIRARAQAILERWEYIRLGQAFSNKRILFMLPIKNPGGGGNVIVFESMAMLKMNVKVEIFNLLQNQNGFIRAYPHLPFPVHFGQVEDISSLALQYDAVIATHNSTVEWFNKIPLETGHPVRGYYIQDFEPLMYAPNQPDYQTAFDSYTLFQKMARFTKTDWTRQEVLKNTGADSTVIGISLDIDLFRPRPQTFLEPRRQPLRIAAMIRPESPYREPEKTMRLLRQAALEFPGDVEIVLFGTEYNNSQFQQYPLDFPWKLYGVLPSEKVSILLSQTDIFADYSSHQAMGLTALEAMACGCAVIVPQKGGATAFCQHETNSLVVDTGDYDNAWLALKRLIQDENLRNTIRTNAIYDVCKYYPERAAFNILDCLFGDL